jgi:hypothetical protein
MSCGSVSLNLGNSELFRYQMAHYRFHKSQASVPVLSHINLAHILKLHLNISFNISSKVKMRVNLAFCLQFVIVLFALIQRVRQAYRAGVLVSDEDFPSVFCRLSPHTRQTVMDRSGCYNEYIGLDTYPSL